MHVKVSQWVKVG